MADFFDRVRGQINAGLTKVSTKSHVTIETTRLGAQVRRIAKEKEEALAQLGSQVYKEMVTNGQLNLEAIQEAVKRVQAMDKAILDLQQEIDRLEALDAATPWAAKEEEKPITTCTCGAPVTEETKFCGDCGTNVEELIAKAKAEQLARIEVTKRTAPMQCPRCGVGVSAMAKFCRSCGAALAPKREATTEPQGASRCIHCGSELAPTARFCRSCGKQIGRETLPVAREGNEAAGDGIADAGEEQLVGSLLDSPEKRES